MPTVINYAERFEQRIFNMYAAELKTTDLTSQDVRFLDAQTIKVNQLLMSGYQDHSRSGGFNQGTVQNITQSLVLNHDRDIKLPVDVMDVDETSQVLSAANTTARFMAQHAIPETDAYRLSSIYEGFVTNGGTPDTANTPNVNDILSKIDIAMEAMDEAEVPEEGRIMYCTPRVFAMLKQTREIDRSINMTPQPQAVNRDIAMLEDLKIVKVPSSRMKTAYIYTNGFTPDPAAQQMNFIILHPSAVIAVVKHSLIELRDRNTQTEVDGYLYINRSYQGCFVLASRNKGVYINVTAPTTP